MMKSRVLCTALVAGLLAAGPAIASIAVSVQPAGHVVNQGDVFSVDIVADIPVTEAIVGWGMDFTIVDPSLVTQTGFTIGPAWDPVPGPTPDGDGLAGLAPTPPGTGISGNGILLATINLTANLINGTTGLVLSDDNAWNGQGPDLTEGFLIDPPPAGNFALVNYTGGSVTVIPEPATLALLALGGLAVLRRRRG